MNSVILIGNLTKDPDTTVTQNGVAVSRFTVAVQRRYANADGNREADFIPVVAWRAQAESCAKYLKRGSKVAVRGSIQFRNYDAQDGTKRYVTEVVAEEVSFLQTRGGADLEGPKDDMEVLPEVQAKKAGLKDAVKPIRVDDGDFPF